MLLDELAGRIASQALVNTGFTVFQGYLPQTPNLAIALYETGGSGMERLMGSSTPWHAAGLQVVVRGAPRDYTTPRRQIEKIYQAMAAWGGFTVGSVRYIDINPLQAPFVVNRDETERVVFAVNFLVMKEPSGVDS